MTVTSVGHETLRVRVIPDNGQPEFESELSKWGKAVNEAYYQAGRWTYVLYDPERPDCCEIDRDRLAKQFGLRPDGDRPHLIPRDPTGVQVSVTGPRTGAPTPSTASPDSTQTGDDLVAGLSRLADLRAAGTLSDAEFAAAKARLLGHGGTA